MTKSFGGLRAVDGVDIELRRGRIHALLGENGAGKSTLISMLCGQYRPDAGEITVAGRRVTFRGPKDSLKAGIGVVHQDFRLVPPFTVTESIVLGTKDRADRKAERRIEELSASLGFHLSPRTRVQDLVVGQQQQTEILKLIYRGMDVLILDEPTAVLTPQQAEQLFAALRTLADGGKAVVFVSHRLGEVAAVADHLTVLRGGRVVADASAHGLEARDLARLMVGEETQMGASRRSSVQAGPVLLELIGARSGGDDRNSLRGADLVLRGGEVVGVAGVSGNGQRALADSVAGTAPLASGTRSTESATIAYIPEDRLGTGLVGSMPIASNLAMRRYRQGDYNPWWISPRTLQRDALPLVEDFRIPAAPTVLAGALSGGGQQRVITAREMSRDPHIVVASQPSRGLDVVSATAVRERLIAVADAGGAVLVISEDLDELLEICDRILVMVAGRLIAELSAADATRTKLGELMTGAIEKEEQ
jgi:ABC-type uncharacterized transport system ATPase subunit